MANFNVSNDVQNVRFDTGSLFGGTYDRDGMDDAGILKLMTVDGKQSLVHTNSVYNIIQTGETRTYDYRVVNIGSISVRTRWDNDTTNDGTLADLGNTFSTTGESLTSDYKLDWSKAKFSSIKFQVPSYGAIYNPTTKDYPSWTTVIEVASTDSVLDLPLRANETDADWVEIYRTKFENATTTANNYNAAFEYQSVIYNWQWVFGTSSAQYLFGNDNVNGTRNDDVLRGYAGDDKLRGGNGNDLLYADYGSDQLFGGAGDDVLVFGGSSSSWDVKNFKYRSSPIELAVGGSGADMFVFRPSEITWTSKEDYYYDMSLPNLYTGTFKYKEVFDSELENAFFKVNSAGDVFAGNAASAFRKAFSPSDNPFSKYQKLSVTETFAAGEYTGTLANSTFVIYSKIKASSSQKTGFDFWVDAVGNIYKLAENKNPNTPSDFSSASIVKPPTAFTATTNPFFTIKQPLQAATANDNGDIFINNVFIKSGRDVVLNERAGDYNGLIDLETKWVEADSTFYRHQSDNWHYNPYMSQSQIGDYHSGTTGSNRAATDPANGLSNLTQRIKIQDFKIGTDKIDLSAFGLSTDVLSANSKALAGLSGTSYLKALSRLLETTEGLKITAAKNGWTSGNTSLFLKELATKTATTDPTPIDYNGNGTVDDTLLEIQLVGINISSLNGRFFGESARTNGSDYEISY
jgi:hypothetical protein